MNRLSFRYGDKEVSNAAILILLLPLFFFLSLASHLSHLNEINFDSSFQSDYIVDGYYYIFLSEQVREMISTGGISALEAVKLVSPNSSSNGIILLSSLTSFLYSDIEFIPFIFLTIYIVLLLPQLQQSRSSLAMIMILFSGLLPYLFIPSKESFFLIGFLLLLIPIQTRISKFFAYPIGILAIVIMLLARSEALFILIIATFVYYLYKQKLLFSLFIISFTCVYFLYFRDLAYAAALAFQLSAESSGTMFCNVGFLDICITDKKSLEITFLQRILTVTLLPFKWIYDVFISFGDPVLMTVRNLLTRTCLLFQILWGYLSFRRIKERGVSIGFIFCFAYILVYTTIFYFQFTRPIIFATSILFILSSFEINSRSNDSRPEQVYNK